METSEMNTDSEIASKVKSIFIEYENKDPEFLNDHFMLSWSDLYNILFVKPNSEVKSQ